MARITVPFDGGPASERALAFACQSLTAPTDEARAVYVVRVPPQLPIGAELPAAQARAAAILARAEALADRYHASLTMLLVLARAVGPGLVAAAEGGDLLVIGQRSRRLMGRVLGGGAVRYVLAHAPCEALVVYTSEKDHGRARSTWFRLARPGPAPAEPRNVLVLPVSRRVDDSGARGAGCVGDDLSAGRAIPAVRRWS